MSMSLAAGSRPFALSVVATLASLTGLVAFTAAAGVVDSMPFATITALAASGLAAWWCATRSTFARHLQHVPRAFRLTFAAGAILVLAQLAVLGTFIIDPNVATWPASVARPWQSRHSCVSAYWVAARQSLTAPDLYLESVYRPAIRPDVPRRPNLGPFFVDVFEYPPTFLPLPRLLAAATPDFWRFRRLWFALNLGAVVFGLVVVARRLDAPLATHALWLTPLVLLSPNVVGTLQAGNVQLLFLVACAVAMLLLERGHHAAGGVLLAYAIASKLFPGVLLLYLLRRGDWRAIGWTAAAGVVLCLVTVIDLGSTPFVAFLHHLPKLLSGEAFPGLFRPEAIAVNESVPGLAFKLSLLGIGGDGFAVAKVVGWVYTVVLIAATWWLAHPSHDRACAPLAWVSILILATMRSPFLPGYGAFPALWLATLLTAIVWHRPAARAVVLALWVMLTFALGQNAAPPLVNAVITLTHTIASFWLVAMAMQLLRDPASVSRPVLAADAPGPALA